MFRKGLVAEVTRLHKDGVSWKRMKELGFEQKSEFYWVDWVWAYSGWGGFRGGFEGEAPSKLGGETGGDRGGRIGVGA